MSLDLLKQIVNSNYPESTRADMDLIAKAYFTTEKQFKGVERGGLDYFTHPAESALNIAKMKMGPVMVAATLLHDLPRRTPYSVDKIEENFGKEIARLVKNIVEIQEIEKNYKGTEKYIESAKKMFVAVAKDFRVLLIKFAEHLNNLEHLETFPAPKQKSIVEFTEGIYIPLSSILGIWRLRWQMDDVCFKYRNPQRYDQLKKKIEKGLFSVREKIVNQVRKNVVREARRKGIPCNIETRFKHVASIYRKMQEREKRFNQIYDVFAVRVVVDSIDSCYLLLGIIHSFWKPVPRRVKDYIAAPKPNGYQSLHTTVFYEDGNTIEFQIRTKEMDAEAKYGVAAHWYYKNPYGNKAVPEWVRGIIEARKIYDSNKKIIEEINIEAMADTIFCYTPTGDIIELPRGSTPVDFAYAIHTELGHYCQSAVINDLPCPLITILKNNDVVEIVKKEVRQPLKSWLKTAVTLKTKNSILKFYTQHPKKK